MKNIAEQVYDHIVQHNTGTQFTSGEAANKLGFHVNPVSAAFHHLEKKGVLHAIGKRKHAFIYEYVSHEPVRFNKPYATGKCSHFRKSGDAHPKRHLPNMSEGNGSTFGVTKGFDTDVSPQQFGAVPATKDSHKEKLSARLLRLAVALEQQKQLRKAAMKSGANVIPPRITQPMLDRLIDIAWEIEVLEHKVVELESKVETRR
jgi:hypothetical protein